MTRFWWVRHGPTHVKTLAGWTDVPADLSDTARLSWLKAKLPEGRLLSSDLSRASATAQALGRGVPETLQALRETHFGAWEGLSAAEVATRWPELSHAVWGAPGDAAPPEGESWHQMSARVLGCIDTLKGEGGDIIIVAHHGPILAALQAALEAPAERILGVVIDNLSITRLDWLPEAQTWRIGGVNHQP